MKAAWFHRCAIDCWIEIHLMFHHRTFKHFHFIAIFSHAKIMWQHCDARCAKSCKKNGAVAADLRINGYLIWNFFRIICFRFFFVCVFCRQQIRFEKLTRTSEKNASKNIQINVYRSVYRFAKANKNHQNLIVNRNENRKNKRERREESLAFAQNTHKNQTQSLCSNEYRIMEL